MKTIRRLSMSIRNLKTSVIGVLFLTLALSASASGFEAYDEGFELDSVIEGDIATNGQYPYPPKDGVRQCLRECDNARAACYQWCGDDHCRRGCRGEYQSCVNRCPQ